MRYKEHLDPISLIPIRGLLSIVSEALSSEFIACYNGWGWNFVTNNIESITNPKVFSDCFSSIRAEFPSYHITYSFLPQFGFDILKRNSLMHGDKVISVKIA